ncbi:MAG: hypothetical protein H6828_15125 [Planctomycetes bacterium]|nr:hypothetical protein [Planctomycetota bacterium]
MPSTPLHPLIVHLPMALAALLPLLSAIVVLAWWRDALPRRAWALVVLLQALLFAGGLVAMNTGEADEERVEEVVPEAALEAHEEAAEVFTWSAGALLALGLLPLLLRREERARQLALVATAGSVMVLGLGYRVGSAGGELVYRHGAAAAWTAAAGELPAGEAWRGGDDDDDERGGDFD